MSLRIIHFNSMSDKKQVQYIEKHPDVYILPCDNPDCAGTTLDHYVDGGYYVCPQCGREVEGDDQSVYEYLLPLV